MSSERLEMHVFMGSPVAGPERVDERATGYCAMISSKNSDEFSSSSRSKNIVPEYDAVLLRMRYEKMRHTSASALTDEASGLSVET
jgi:hypothetical protein